MSAVASEDFFASSPSESNVLPFPSQRTSETVAPSQLARATMKMIEEMNVDDQRAIRLLTAGITDFSGSSNQIGGTASDSVGSSILSQLFGVASKSVPPEDRLDRSEIFVPPEWIESIVTEAATSPDLFELHWEVD